MTDDHAAHDNAAPDHAGEDDAVRAGGIRTRRREIAVEHVLFKVIEHVEAISSGLLDAIAGSLDHLGDPAHDGTGDDEAVRAIVRKMVAGARRTRGG